MDTNEVVFTTKVPTGRNSKLIVIADCEDYIAKKRAEWKAQDDAVAAAAVEEKPAEKKESKPKKKNDWSARKRTVTEDEIQCTKCGEMKEYEDFYSDKTNKDGVMNWCKECLKEHRASKKAASAPEAEIESESETKTED